METKHTLISPMGEHIGQVKLENAFEEIIRLNKQENTNSWRIDCSPFLYCPDESSDGLVNNPSTLHKGYVWVTKTRELSNVEKAAPELLQALKVLPENTAFAHVNDVPTMIEKAANLIEIKAINEGDALAHSGIVNALLLIAKNHRKAIKKATE